MRSADGVSGGVLERRQAGLERGGQAVVVGAGASDERAGEEVGAKVAGAELGGGADEEVVGLEEVGDGGVGARGQELAEEFGDAGLGGGDAVVAGQDEPRDGKGEGGEEVGEPEGGEGVAEGKRGVGDEFGKRQEGMGGTEAFEEVGFGRLDERDGGEGDEVAVEDEDVGQEVGEEAQDGKGGGGGEVGGNGRGRGRGERLVAEKRAAALDEIGAGGVDEAGEGGGRSGKGFTQQATGAGKALAGAFAGNAHLFADLALGGGQGDGTGEGAIQAIGEAEGVGIARVERAG